MKPMFRLEMSAENEPSKESDKGDQMDEKSMQTTPGSSAAPKRAAKKPAIIAAVVAVVLACAGAGLWVWHEQPSFCGTVCHTPMAEYVDTFNQVSGQAGTDKYGNEVQDAGSMMAVVHREAGEDCLSCHVPTIGEQVAEGMHWVTGDYVYPMNERSQADLTEARGVDEDEFCLNGECHDVTTREELFEATADRELNPHETQHGEMACTDCHKAHRTSVLICAQCHDEAEVPEGWVAYDESLAVLPGAGE